MSGGVDTGYGDEMDVSLAEVHPDVAREFVEIFDLGNTCAGATLRSMPSNDAAQQPDAMGNVSDETR